MDMTQTNYFFFYFNKELREEKIKLTKEREEKEITKLIAFGTVKSIYIYIYERKSRELEGKRG